MFSGPVDRVPEAVAGRAPVQGRGHRQPPEEQWRQRRQAQLSPDGERLAQRSLGGDQGCPLSQRRRALHSCSVQAEGRG